MITEATIDFIKAMKWFDKGAVLGYLGRVLCIWCVGHGISSHIEGFHSGGDLGLGPLSVVLGRAPGINKTASFSPLLCVISSCRIFLPHVRCWMIFAKFESQSDSFEVWYSAMHLHPSISNLLTTDIVAQHQT